MKKVLLCLILVVATYSNVFAYLNQGHWRWRNNDGSETAATWKAGQDTAITINDNKAIRLRIDVFNGQSTTKGYGTGLEYATAVKGPWLPVSTAVINNPFILAGDNSFITDNEETTQQLNEPGKTFAFGRVVTLSADHSDSLLTNQRKEYEWCIKPTAFIAPNTKYYFRTPVGGDQTNNEPSLTTGNAFAIPPAILSNGNFEQDLTDWTNSDPSGQTIFAVEDTAVHEGNKALRVTVKASNTGNIQTSHAAFATNSSRVQLIRFWAKADVNNASLILNVAGATTNLTCKFRTVPQWQRYQFAFKTQDASMALKFNYQTKANYVLDAVTVQDDTDPVVDVPMTYMWQNNNRSYGWLTADGQESIKLPDGRVAWFFSDTWLGYNDTTNNFTSTNRLVNNPLVVQDGAPPNGTLTTLFSGTQNNALAFMIPPVPVGAQYWYWPRDPIVEGNTLKVLLPEVDRPTQNAAPANSNIEDIGIISLPDLKLLRIENLPYLKDQYYSDLLAGDSTSQYSYAYGEHNGALVARYPKGQLSGSVPWEFYTGNDTWVKDYTKAVPIGPYVFGTVMQLGPNNFVGVFMPNLSNSVDAMFAPNPWGPWSNHTVLYHVPDLANGITYYASLHRETGNNGVYTVSYSSNTTIQNMLDDEGTYQPHYAKANLLALSPYTVKKSADSLLTFTLQPTDSSVKLNWTTANKDDNHFDVEHSTDGTNWELLTTVAGTDTASAINAYQTVDASPVEGINYYRIKLYDIDSKLTISAVKTATFHAPVKNAALVNFTAVLADKKVQLDWSTSSETINPGFNVQRTADTTAASNWLTIGTVPGKGTTTTTTTSTYQQFDDNPLTGTSYYRLQYYSNGVPVTSVVRVINLIEQTSFTIYPNPTTDKIKFSVGKYAEPSFTATLVNTDGKVLDKETFYLAPDGIYTLKVKPITGVYILKVAGKGLNTSGKVIVQ